MSGQICKCCHCIGYRRERFGPRVGRQFICLLSGRRRAVGSHGSFIGSELFLKTLLLEKRWIGEQEEAWRQLIQEGEEGSQTRALAGRVQTGMDR